MTAPVLPRDTAQVTTRGALRRWPPAAQARHPRNRRKATAPWPDTVIAAAPEGPPAHLYAVRGVASPGRAEPSRHRCAELPGGQADDWWFPRARDARQPRYPPGSTRRRPGSEILQRAAAIAAYTAKRARQGGGGLWHTRRDVASPEARKRAACRSATKRYSKCARRVRVGR